MPYAHAELEVPRWRIRILEVATVIGGACVTVGGWLADAGMGLARATADWAVNDCVRSARVTGAGESSRESN
jgi:hypothetical protein